MTTIVVNESFKALDVEKIWERGYAILRGVYTPEEIAAFREAAYASRGWGGDLLANPRLRSAVTDGRMVAVAQKLLGTDDLFYSGDSSFTINGTQRGWHKDNTDRVDPKAPDWDSRYTAPLRHLLPGPLRAHRRPEPPSRLARHPEHHRGREPLRKTRPGDLAVWSMRITHSATACSSRTPWLPSRCPPSTTRSRLTRSRGRWRPDRDLRPHWRQRQAREALRGLHQNPQVPRRCVAPALLRRRSPSGGGRGRVAPARHAGRGHGRPACRAQRTMEAFPYAASSVPAAAKPAPSAPDARSATAAATTLAKRALHAAKAGARGAVNSWKQSGR